MSVPVPHVFFYCASVDTYLFDTEYPNKPDRQCALMYVVSPTTKTALKLIIRNAFLSIPIASVTIVLCTSGIKYFVYQRAEGELINRILNATSA